MCKAPPQMRTLQNYDSLEALAEKRVGLDGVEWPTREATASGKTNLRISTSGLEKHK